MLFRFIHSEIRKINPAARFIPNTGGGALSDLDMKTVGEQQVTVLPPAGFEARQVRLLRSGSSPAFDQAGGRLKVTVPSILDHEGVAVDL